MLVIQCLLVLIGLLATGGFLTLYSLLYDIRQNQVRSSLLLIRFEEGLLGEHPDGGLNNIAYDLHTIAEFTRDARRGYIPHLRYDDWYAKKEDLARWEHAAIMETAHT